MNTLTFTLKPLIISTTKEKEVTSLQSTTKEKEVTSLHKNVFSIAQISKKGPNYSHEHYVFRWIWHHFLEIWAKVKSFLKLSHLYLPFHVGLLWPYVWPSPEFENFFLLGMAVYLLKCIGRRCIGVLGMHKSE